MKLRHKSTVFTRWLILLLSLLHLCSPANAQSPALEKYSSDNQLGELEGAPVLAFRDLLSQVIADNPGIDIADARIIQAEQLSRQNGSYRFPTIALEGEIGPEYNDPVTTTESGHETTNGRNLSLTVSKLLFDGGASRAEFQRSQRLERAARADARSVIEELFTDVASSYIDYWQFQEDLVQVKRFVSTMQELADDLNEMYRGGAASKLEADFARARLASARAAASSAAASLNNAFSELAYLAPGVELFSAAPPDSFAQIKLADVQSYLDRAIVSNSEFLTNQESINATRLRVRSQRGQFLPTLNFELSGSLIDDEGGTSERRDKVSAKLLLNYTLYSGGVRRGGVRRAEAQLIELEAERAQLERDVLRDIDQLFNNITASRLTLSAVLDEIDANEELQRLNRQNLDRGTVNIIELIDVEERLFNARARKDAVVATMHKQYIDLMITSGNAASIMEWIAELLSNSADQTSG